MAQEEKQQELEPQRTRPAPYPLSSSSARALEISARRTSLRGAPELSSVDLLVGIFRSHGDDSEPLQLLEHVQLRPQHVGRLLQRDGGFGPVGTLMPGTLSRDEASAEAANGPEVDAVLAHAQQLVAEHHRGESPCVRLRDLFGGLLLTDNEACELLGEALLESFLTLELVRVSYPQYLTWRERPVDYAEFLREHHPRPDFHFAGFAADVADDADLVGIGPEVNAMAYLVAARSLAPPLAVGLFGDWGSGKSFFMQALKRRIENITRYARESGRPQREVDVYKYVVQIEFNAWHYVEGELWASLVEHILRNLKRGGENVSEVLRRKRYWLDKLAGARQDEAEVRGLKEQLEHQLDDKMEEIEKAERAAEETRRKLQRLTEQDVLDLVELSEEEQAELREVIDAAGFGGTVRSASELAGALEESIELLTRGNVVLAPLRAAGVRGVLWVLVVAGVAIAGPLLGYLLEKWAGLSALHSVIATLGGFLTAASGALVGVNTWVRKWVERAEHARAMLAKKREEHEGEFVGQIAELRTQQSEVTERLEQVRRDGEAKRREIRELEQELDGITPGRVLLDFVNERVGSEDYRKHLGVAALIRHDFEKLSELIAQSNKKFVEADTGEMRDTEDERNRINRIVLYIDDLDRCPPARVVEVLQAVHLLMAFPLFVVVVAVDTRWLSQSLRTHYEELLSATDSPGDSGSGQASAQDYLEKIFQIPFRVKPLPENARMRIVQRLAHMGPDRDRLRQHTPERDASARGATAVADVLSWDGREPERPLVEDEPPELRPPGLEISEAELAYMHSLRALLGPSPRAVKRFMNVYRLVKASATLRRSGFVSDASDADYKLVLFLLAVVTGLGAVSEALFRAIQTGRMVFLGDIVDLLRSEAGKPDSVVCTTLERLEQWIDEPQAEGNDRRKMSVARLGEWAPQIARFSFRIELD